MLALTASATGPLVKTTFSPFNMSVATTAVGISNSSKFLLYVNILIISLTRFPAINPIFGTVKSK
ncbi:Uncharacterised protein [Streptococcus pneumoniae]|nr:Uncharacterised protein [Streptococcus pneumoniae]